MNREDFRLDIDGREIEAARWGPSPDAAPTIVMLHEGLGCVALWRDFPRLLAEHTGCGVFAYSRFGYGNSAPAPLPWPTTYMHDEGLKILPRVLDAAGIGRFILLGHSDGGSIATIFSGGVQDFRQRGAILIAPHFFTEEMGLRSIAAARTAYDTGTLRPRLARYHADVDNAFRGWNGAWLHPDFRAWRIDDYLATIRVPLLVLQGEADEYGTPAQLDCAAAEAYCPVDTALIPGAGHSPHLSHAAEIFAHIVPFVRRIRALEDITAPMHNTA
jgi:pimeloyl-ACP methyl ester carboxylesterase